LGFQSNQLDTLKEEEEIVPVKRNHIRFTYKNFWLGFTPEEGEYVITKVFSHAMNKLGLSIVFDNQDPDIVLSSIFGQQSEVFNEYPRAKHVLLMFENPHKPRNVEYLDSSRYFAGFGSMSSIPHKGRPNHSFQMPMWLYDNHLNKERSIEESWSENVLVATAILNGTHLLPDGRLIKIESLKQKMISLSQETPFLTKYIKGNASLVASVDTQHLRAQLLKVFKEEGVHVDCPGKVGHNFDDGLFGPFREQKHFFIFQRIFNICPESGFAPGYVTEKLWQAAIFSAIPIYWGDMSAFDRQVFSMKRIIFVDMKNITDVRRVAKFVHQLLENPVMLTSFYQQPTFLPNAWFAIQRRLREWNVFVMSIIKHTQLREI